MINTNKEIMVTNLQKRRIVYICDRLWEEIENLAIKEGCSKSRAIRLMLRIQKK